MVAMSEMYAMLAGIAYAKIFGLSPNSNVNQTNEFYHKSMAPQ
jgi:hypothetical protein